ncbi:MAG TPA: PepSY-like domain-containing protein [Opitutaceae bacterium]|nr:PepSY-like domain-containing protein [Opitutaceae bacterium]
MKANLLKGLLALAISAAPIPAFAADRVDPAQLPPAVKKALDEAARGEPVKEITIHGDRERAVYDVELDRKNAPNPHVRITEQGQVVSDARTVPATEAPLLNPYGVSVPANLPRLRLEQLPNAAQQTIRREAAGRDITAITEDTVDGRKAYSVQFRESGRNPSMYVAEDGTVLRPAEKPPALGFGTTFSDAPAMVQQTIRREIGDGQIERVEKLNEGGEPSAYKVSVKDSRGTYELRISADGRVLGNTRRNAPSAKRD